MEESYGYEEPYEPTEPGYAYTPSPPTHSRSAYPGHHYEPEYEPEYYRESSIPYGKHRKILLGITGVLNRIKCCFTL